MAELIGFWLICLAVVIIILSIEPDFDFKDKLKQGFVIMLFLTILMVGVFLMCGSEV